MSSSQLAGFLFTYSLQLALVVGLGLLLPTLLRIRQPRFRLAYLQCLLAVSLLLPMGVLRPRGPEPSHLWGQSGLVSYETLVVRPVASAALPLVVLVLLLVAGGVALRAGWILYRTFALVGVVRRGSEYEPQVAAVRSMRRQLGRGVRLIVSESVTVPVTFGLRRPTVLLPPDFDSLPAPTQEAILCHELIHVRRRDWLFHVFEEAVQTILWFHPIVRWLKTRIAVAREQVVDRAVVELTGQRRSYLEALVLVARSQKQTGWAPATCLIERHDLKERVALMLQEVSMSKSRTRVTWAVCAAVVLGSSVAAARAFPWASLERAEPELGRAPATSPQESQGEEKPSEPVFVTGDIERPIKVFAPSPEYTEEARKNKVQGTVILQVVITKQGSVDNVKVLKQLGMGLDEAAVAAIETWRFEPATLDGEPVAVHYNLTVNFRLDPGDGGGEDAGSDAK